MKNQLWPAHNVERRPLASLIPYAGNARTHSPEQVEQIAASIREWGWTMPILIDEKDGILAGHGRVLAARQLAVTEVPVIVALGWSAAQKRAYALADNKLAENAGWDRDLLKVEIGALGSLGFDLGLAGFSGAELAAIAAWGNKGLTDPDDVPEPSGIRSQIIWAKDRFALSRGDYHWRHEPCWYAVRKGEKSHWQGDRSQDTVWEIPAREDDGHGHGTQKPVECMKRPIENNSMAGDAVYDPFIGSGTTIIAAELTARRCLAIEIDPVYVDVAIRRWQRFTGKQAIHEASGELFGEKAAA